MSGCPETLRLGTSEIQAPHPLAPAPPITCMDSCSDSNSSASSLLGLRQLAPLKHSGPPPALRAFSLMPPPPITSSWGSDIYSDVRAGLQSPPAPITLMEPNPLPGPLAPADSSLPAVGQDKVLPTLTSLEMLHFILARVP